MEEQTAGNATVRIWKPHPDDESDVGEALRAAHCQDLLSPEVSEAFLRWLEGAGSESWRAELE